MRTSSSITPFSIQEQIDASAIREYGGVALFVDQVSNGNNKRGHQFQDKGKLVATYLLNFYPPAKMTNENIKQLAAATYSMCDDAIRRLGTSKKEGGCTQGIKYYRPSKAKHYNDPGQIGGLIQMAWDGVKVADFSLDFANDA